MTCIILADDQPIFRAGTARLLAAAEGFEIASECETLHELRGVAGQLRGCIVIASSTLGTPAELSALLRAGAHRLILVVPREETLSRSAAAGLHGWISRGTEAGDLLQCVRAVAEGRRVVEHASSGADPVGQRVLDRLTRRELAIVGHIMAGRKNREIAAALATTEQVIKNHLRSVYDKIGVSDRLELALFALHHRTLSQAASQAAQQQKPSADPPEEL